MAIVICIDGNKEYLQNLKDMVGSLNINENDGSDNY